MLGELRAAAPLRHPMWNLLLVHALLADPVCGAPSRHLFVSYELWRSGLVAGAPLDLAPVLEVNRARVQRLERRHRRSCEDAAAFARTLAAQLVFMLGVVIVAYEHSVPQHARTTPTALAQPTSVALPGDGSGPA